jgi:hypothetical protein
MKDFHELVRTITESVKVTFGKPERFRGKLEGRSIRIPILLGNLEIGEIKADFEVHGRTATSRGAGYEVIDGYSVEYMDARLRGQEQADSVRVGGQFDSAPKALNEVKRRVAARVAALDAPPEGVSVRKVPTLRERLKGDPKAWAHWSYVEVVLPQMAAGAPVRPPVRPDVAGVLSWSDDMDSWLAYEILRGAILRLTNQRHEAPFASQMKHLAKEISDKVTTDSTATQIAAAVSRGIARFNKIRSMMERA